MATQDQVNAFHQYASQQIAGGMVARSIDELFDKWRFENLGGDESAENVAAVQAAIDDMNAGDTGRDAAKIELEMRRELKLPTSK